MGLIAVCAVVSALARWPLTLMALITFGMPLLGVLLACWVFPPKQLDSSLAREAVIGGCLGVIAGTIYGVIGLYMALGVVNGDDRIDFTGWLGPIYGPCCSGVFLGAATGSLVRLWQSLGRRRSDPRESAAG